MFKLIETNFNYTKELIPLDLTKVETIIIHHAEAFEASPEDIHRWHLDAGKDSNSPMYGCCGAGYGFYIRLNGASYKMRGFNIGAQCSGMNSKSIGICCEGNWEINTDKIPEEMMISLIDCINYVRNYLLKSVTIEPHMKFTSTLCPGRFLFNQLPKIRVCADVFKGIDKLTNKQIYQSPDYWKKRVWNELNIDINFYKASMINIANKL